MPNKHVSALLTSSGHVVSEPGFWVLRISSFLACGWSLPPPPPSVSFCAVLWLTFYPATESSAEPLVPVVCDRDTLLVRLLSRA